jgi:uncharacterized damage-inducible protein DinB
MLATLRDLLAHKAFADGTLLSAIQGNPAAVGDHELRALLGHMLIANRFWALTILGRPFVYEDEARERPSFESLAADFRHTHGQELEWAARATEGELLRTLDGPLIPGGRCTVTQAVMQVCLHSQGHRAQCATRLRSHGTVPPTTDFILWLSGRPAPPWPADA